MATRRDDLDQALADLELLCKKITTGTADRPRHTRVVDLAITRMEEWAATAPPANTIGPRGGSSSPREVEERAEDRDVGRNAATDHQTALTLIHTISVAATNLHAIAIRYTKPIDHSKLPQGPTVPPGCVSCARTKRRGPVTYGGFFAEIADRYREQRLCRWCGDHTIGGEYPPIEAVDIYHRQTPQAAGRWLARQQQPTASTQRAATCGHPVWTSTGDQPCTRPPMHDGACSTIGTA